MPLGSAKVSKFVRWADQLTCTLRDRVHAARTEDEVVSLRVVRILTGMLLIAVGLGFIAGGSIAVASFGTEGELDLASPVFESHKDSRALLMDVDDIDAGFPASNSLGKITIGAQAAEFGGTFIGLAATSQVDEYLLGVSYDVIHYSGGTWETRAVPGTNSPEPPKEQQFWRRESVGTSPSIQFVKAPGPSTSFVVMNVEGKAGVKARITVGYRSSVVFPMAVAAIVIGVVLIAIVTWLSVRGNRKRSRAQVEPTAAMPATALVQPEGSSTADVVSGSGSEGEVDKAPADSGGKLDPSAKNESEVAGASEPGPVSKTDDVDSNPQNEDGK